MELSGYIIKYNTLSHPLATVSGRKVYERMLPGAFADSVASINRGDYKIKANVDHVTDSSLMKLGESLQNVALEHRPDGVFMRMQLVDDSLSRDTFAKVQANLVKGLSIEFTPPPGVEAAYEVVNGGDYIRSWGSAKLTGFAVVDGAMYPDAIVSASDTPTFSRSQSKVEIEQINTEIAALELERQRTYYKYESFLLGIR